jgi:hypothetical protein
MTGWSQRHAIICSVLGDLYATNTHFVLVFLVVGLVITVIRRLRNRTNRPRGDGASADDRISSVFRRKPGTAEELAARAEAESGRAEVGSEGNQQPTDRTGQRDL